MQALDAGITPCIVNSYQCMLCMRIRVPRRLVSRRLQASEATFDPLHVAVCFVGPETARKRLVASSNSFAYWLFHAITFEIHELKSKKSL